MTNEIIINGGKHRYLSELPQFKDGLPFGVINKTIPDVGGTYVAINCPSNYIVVCPFRDLVDSIAADENNAYRVFKCYGKTKLADFEQYLDETNGTYRKIAVTYDSLSKLVSWMESTAGWKVLVDEYHLILEEMDYRYNAIDSMMNEIKKFSHFSFLSATPIKMEYEIDFFKKLPHYKVIWDSVQQIQLHSYKASRVISGVARFI